MNLLLLAILLWLFVVTGNEYETVVEIPLVMKNIKPGRTLISDVPSSVRVRFKGTGRGLIALKTFKNAQLELDLSTIYFFYDYPLRLDFIKFPSNLQLEPVEIIEPDTVKVILEELVESELEVVPRIEIELCPGYVMPGELRILPSKIKVSGPASVMEGLQSVYTDEAIYLNLEGNLKAKVGINLPYPLSAEINEVVVQAKVERLTEIWFRAIPITVENPPTPFGVRLEPENISVKVRGGVSIIKNLTEEQISAKISFPRHWSEDITKCVPELTLPEGVELVEMEPDTVLMTLVEG